MNQPSRRLRVIDSHTGGEPTRTVLDGLAADELESWRRAVLCEPRGHEVLVGALLEPPRSTEAVARVTFFNNVGLLGMCGHGMIGVAATLRHLGRIGPGCHRLETPVGDVVAELRHDGRVSLRNVRSWRKAANVRAGGVSGDVAWGGNWFFLVSDHGLELSLDRARELTDACLAMREAVHAAGYPEVDHVELFAPPRDPCNDSRNFVLCPGGEYDRSPCGTGTSAKLACLAADGRLGPGQTWRQEGIVGSVFEGSYQPEPDKSDTDGGVIPTITGSAFVTAEATLLFEPDDPFRLGIGSAGS